MKARGVGGCNDLKTQLAADTEKSETQTERVQAVEAAWGCKDAQNRGRRDSDKQKAKKHIFVLVPASVHKHKNTDKHRNAAAMHVNESSVENGFNMPLWLLMLLKINDQTKTEGA